MALNLTSGGRRTNTTGNIIRILLRGLSTYRIQHTPVTRQAQSRTHNSHQSPGRRTRRSGAQPLRRRRRIRHRHTNRMVRSTQCRRNRRANPRRQGMNMVINTNHRRNGRFNINFTLSPNGHLNSFTLFIFDRWYRNCGYLFPSVFVNHVVADHRAGHHHQGSHHRH